MVFIVFMVDKKFILTAAKIIKDTGTATNQM